MTNLQTAVEATDECRRSFEEWYVKDYGEKEYYKSNTKAQVWVAFQAAWNARQPEANMLDLGGVERLPGITSDRLTKIIGDELRGATETGFFYVEVNHRKLADAILARLKGVKHG
jgi:hypothetical protein